MKININEIENRITFKTEYTLEHLTSEKMRLLGSTKSKIAKYIAGENISYLYLELTDAALVHCNIGSNY